ncbi:tyrosine-type recombinase/integrase [Celerinatantimonas sp. MCCC 1A17872]|uniref:tyrosine-type recombinase/integrase n=1 Tax=Celerinatantimonas sp. MCCC 1A17872 TaxID=3177514 RepID=UPI0038C28C6A
MSVAYTIQRNGNYHINVRIGPHIFRRSLATDSQKVAQIMVDKLIPIVTELRKKGGVSEEQIFAGLSNALSALIKQVQRRFEAVVSPLSREADNELDDYQDLIGESLYDCPSEVTPESWEEFVLSKLNDPKEIRSVLLEKIFPKHSTDRELLNVLFKYLIDSQDPLYHRAEASFMKVLGEFRKIRIALEFNNEAGARSIMNELLAFAEKSENSWKDIQKDNEEEHAPKLDQASIDEPVSQIQHNALSGSTNMTLEDLFNEYIDAHSKKWTLKILKDNQRKSELLLILLGRNTLISQISGRELDTALSTALSLPKRNTKPYSKYTTEKCVSIAQLDEIDDDVRVSPKTIKEHKKFLQSCFKFARYQRYISISPTDGMLLKFPKTSDRGCFSNSEVREILDYCLQQTDALWHWAIPIMAYTGMRNSEVMQLRKMDIKTDSDSGISYIHVTTEAGSVKTKAGVRRVPIHNALLDAGFLAFVDSVESGENTLFNGDGRTLTRMYGTLKRKINLPDVDEALNQLTLYSLRHRVVTSLRSAGVQTVHMQAIVGHKLSGSGQSDGYTHPEQFTIPQLKAAIDQLSYQSIPNPMR